MPDIDYQPQTSIIGVRLLRMAVIYLLLGLLLGLGMAIAGQFQLRPVHTHINLLGWASLGLSGLIYCLFPHLGESALARWHAWLHNLGLPLMMGALAAYHLGHPESEALLAVGSLLTVTGLGLFAINVLKNIQPTGIEIIESSNPPPVRGER